MVVPIASPRRDGVMEGGLGSSGRSTRQAGQAGHILALKNSVAASFCASSRPAGRSLIPGHHAKAVNQSCNCIGSLAWIRVVQTR